MMWAKQMYTAVSIAFVIPILCWPLALQLGLEPAWGTSIEKNWLVAASLLLMIFTVVDMLLPKWQGWYDAVERLIWVLFAGYIVIITLQHVSLAWFLAAALALRALWISPMLWQNQGVQWWQWQAWWRDASAALIMFIWLIYW